MEGQADVVVEGAEEGEGGQEQSGGRCAGLEEDDEEEGEGEGKKGRRKILYTYIHVYIYIKCNGQSNIKLEKLFNGQKASSLPPSLSLPPSRTFVCSSSRAVAASFWISAQAEREREAKAFTPVSWRRRQATNAPGKKVGSRGQESGGREGEREGGREGGREGCVNKTNRSTIMYALLEQSFPSFPGFPPSLPPFLPPSLAHLL